MNVLVLTHESNRWLGCVTNQFFLDWRIFKLHRLRNLACQCSYASLGRDQFTWWKTTVSERVKIYDLLIEKARKVLSANKGIEINNFQAQILVGHLCMALAGKLSKTLLQIKSIRKGEIRNKQTYNLSIRFPSSSLESYELLASKELTLYVEGEICRLELKSDVDVILQAHEGETSSFQEPEGLASVYVKLSAFLARFSHRNKYMIVGSYLGRLREVLLNLSLGQIPWLSEIRSFKTSMRVKNLRADTKLGACIDFDQLLDSLLLLVLPSNALVPNSLIAKQSRELGWPARPKVIFTSNNFDTDDLFKAYIANNLDVATYIVGQHGNNYGTSITSALYPETWLADTFVTWGWRSFNNDLPIGVLKPRLRLPKVRHVDGFLVILRDEWRYSFESDSRFGFDYYMNYVEELLDRLTVEELTLRIRPHHATPVDCINRLREKYREISNVSFSLSGTPLRRDLKSKFPVFTYDSTGIQEFSSEKVEFAAYIPDGLLNIRTQFRRNYESLERANILTDHLEIAVSNLLAISNQSFQITKNQKNAISLFSKELCIRNNKTLRELRSLILKSSLARPISSRQSMPDWNSLVQ